MRLEDIHVGDILRIKDWDDMEAEFGLTRSGSIMCQCGFLPEMKYLCGKVFTVKSIEPGYLRSVEGYEIYGLGRIWGVSSDMVEPLSFSVDTADESYTSISLNELRDFLNL